MALAWSLLVDWDGDGVLDTDEGGRMIGLDVTRGRARQFNKSGLERMAVGRAQITLENHDRRFSPWYSSSPLYPNLVPRRYAELTVDDGATEYAVMRGFIDEPKVGDSDRATLIMEDGWRWLKDRKALIGVQTNVGTGSAITQILENVSWPEISWRLGVSGVGELGETTYIASATPQVWTWGKNVDPGLDVIPYWWAHGKAADEIHDLVASEFGFAYVAADGQFIFLDRQSLYEATPALTLSQSVLLRDMALGQPSENIWNLITVRASPRTVASQTEIWRLRGTIPPVRAGEQVVYRANLEEPATAIQDPAASSDYTMNAASDGSGADLTGNFAVTATKYGQAVDLTIRNNGPVEGYITLLKLRGQLVESLSSQYRIAEDGASQLAYGPREMDINLRWQQSNSQAQDYANWLLSWLADPRPRPIVRMENRSATQFGYDLGTAVTVDVAYHGLNAQMVLGYIHHRWLTSNGQRVETEWRLEGMDLSDYWLLGQAGRGELGSVSILGY